jgi:O-antigen ligase
VVLAFSARPEVAAFATVFTYASGITVPYLPGQLGVFYVLVAGLGCLLLLLIAFRRASIEGIGLTHWLLIAFVCLILFTGFYRGMGFQAFGSDLWGGFYYIQLIFTASLVFSLPRVNMPARWWPTAAVSMAALSILPLIADMLVLRGVNFGLVRMFVLTGGDLDQQMGAQMRGDLLQRLTSAGVTAQSLVIGFLVVVPTAKLFKVKSAPAILLLMGIVFLSLLSGFRMMTLLVMVVVLFAALFQRSLTGLRVVFGILASIGVVLALYLVSESLPPNIQRAISWLPGISISDRAAEDASGTIAWRLDVWREAIRLIPEYFWIGKGFAYDGNLLIASRSGYDAYDSIRWALVAGGYHNGYLSLILCLGALGLVLGLAMLVSTALRLLRLNGQPWKDPKLHQCYQAFLAAFTCWVLVFLTVYGDVQAVFPGLFFNWAVLEALRKADEKLSVRSFESLENMNSEESIYSETGA